MNFYEFLPKKLNFSEFIEIYANFSTFFDAFFLPILPNPRKLTHQSPFLTQKRGFALKIRKKTWKNPNFPQFLKFHFSGMLIYVRLWSWILISNQMFSMSCVFSVASLLFLSIMDCKIVNIEVARRVLGGIRRSSGRINYSPPVPELTLPPSRRQ